jgi:acetoin:2,6-dichlorophenolindophenol oxidoreductase subunit alpha
MEAVLSEAGLHENPLVPNKKLRQMYAAMAEARALDEHIAKMQKGVKARRKIESTHGQEACRVSTAIDLQPGDLVSDSNAGVVMDLLSGTRIDSLLKRVAEFNAGKTDGATLSRDGASGRQLPWVDDAVDRLKMAMGAALSFKTLKRENVVVAYVRRDQLAKRQWRQALELVSQLELPMIVVVLPGIAQMKKDSMTNLSSKARSWGLPGIPVDASDAVALYRVAQESLGRARMGGGPVLIECVAYKTKGGKDDSPDDPLVQMKGFLLDRKVCTEAWLQNTGDSLRKRLPPAK